MILAQVGDNICYYCPGMAPIIAINDKHPTVKHFALN